MLFVEPLKISAKQARAFWTLNLLAAQDIPRIAMHWLEDGSDSTHVAYLAGTNGHSLETNNGEFENALSDEGSSSLTKDEAIVVTLHYYINAIAKEQIDALSGSLFLVEELMDLAHGLDASFRIVNPKRTDEDTTDYVGNVLGLEYIVGTYYSLDDIHEMGRSPTAEEIRFVKRDLIEESIVLLDVLAAIPIVQHR